ncbi:unnamed protein product [Enterobius vermicularis]|uniref:3'-5' exonuclease domain-containing protein n=1 Tax=Enterobius vermicularis TaxID=51028 RepID=A0A158Q9I8_ENTVE|nr:unnamed protein product [Enterobius vermicularis]
MALQAVCAVLSIQELLWAREQFALHKAKLFAKLLSYEEFCRSIANLVKDLRKQTLANGTIDEGYAYAVVKQCAKNFYVDKIWKAEQLHEVLYTVLQQRPSMKKFVINLLEKKYGDSEMARRWIVTEMKSRLPQDVPPLSTVTFSSENTTVNFWTSNSPFLSIPENVSSVSFVNDLEKLQRLTAFLENYSYDNRPVAALDSEWSSYRSYPKSVLHLLSHLATILQIAFPNNVYILDLDGLERKHLNEFLSKLFGDKRITKIGFQFSEDLTHICRAVPICESLYNPKNLICVDRIVNRLLGESSKHPDVGLDGIINVVDALTLKNLKDTEGVLTPSGTVDGESDVKVQVGEVDSEDDRSSEASITEEIPENTCSRRRSSSDEEKMLETVSDKKMKKAVPSKRAGFLDEKKRKILRTGLSGYCEFLFGSPLDKTEQCSVWDRRPLRDLQTRYAALDAYVVLMMFEKCVEWARRFGLDVYDLCASEPPMKVQLPLFFNVKVGVYGRIWDFPVRAAIELQMYRGPQLSSRKLCGMAVMTREWMSEVFMEKGGSQNCGFKV